MDPRDEPTPNPAWTAPVTPPPAGTTAGPAATARPRPGQGPMWANLLLGLAAVVAVGGIAFAAGRMTAPTQVGAAVFPGRLNVDGQGGPLGSFDPNAAPGGPGGRPGAFGGAGLTVDGTVASVDGSTMVVTTSTGESMTFTLDGETTYHESTSGSAADMAVGDTVSVRLSGTGFQAGGNGDGSPDLTADDVTVRR